ncbi:MAG TPA: sugar phosphate isomerase/epimerase [bacterium]|nr:sugar phosphate isomerase/epimerase [bacterium]
MMPRYQIACHTRAWKPEQWKESLDEIAGLGFAGVEGVSALFEKFADKTELAKKHLHDRHLKLAALAGSGVFTIPGRREEMLHQHSALARFLQKLGTHHLLVTLESREIIESLSHDFKAAAALLDELGKRCLDFFDVYLCVLPQRGSRIETGDEIDRLMNLVDLDAVFLGLDTGQFVLMEEEPAKILKTYGECVRHLHFSDPVTNEKEEKAGPAGAYPEYGALGEGRMNFAEIKDILEVLDYHGWITAVFDTSHEPPRETAERSKRFLDHLFGTGEQAL